MSNQLTYNNLPPDLKKITQIVCPEKEVFWLGQNCPDAMIIKQPEPLMGIAEKRKWIVESCGELTKALKDAGVEEPEDKIVMLDDDLRFAVRREDDPGLFRKANDEDIIKAFKELEEILSPEFPHAGFSARGGGISMAAQDGGWQQGKRMMYILGYHVPTVLENAEFGRIGTHEDMDICLQLLSKGFPNKVNFSFVVDQKFGSSGGCTEERTIEKNNADAYLLEKLHPQFVKATEKIYKSSQSRVEVVCQWKQALQYGLQQRQQRI